MSETIVTTAAPPRTCRILYYGPTGSGKTANLARIEASVPPAYRLPPAPGDGAERFRFRVDAGELGSWIVVAEVADAAVIGAPIAAGRGFPFDGVVFVADSCADRLDLNLSALETFKTDLEAGGLDLTSLPVVIQYNKQDAPGRLPVERLESLLNPWGLPSFPAVTSRGEGVRETLRAVLALALRQLDRATRAPDPEGGNATASADAGRGTAGADGTAPPLVTPVQEDRALRIEPDEPSEALFASRRPPVVVPVRVPRSLLERYGTVRIVLEIEVDGPRTGLD